MPMQYNNGKHKSTITLEQWLNAGLSYELFKSDKKRGYLKTRGRACFSKSVEIIWDSMRERRKKVLREAGYDPNSRVINRFEQHIQHDHAAYAFLSSYIKPDGSTLQPDEIDKYYANACVLNAVISVYNMRVGMRRKCGGNTRDVLAEIIESVHAMSEDAKARWPRRLPKNRRRFKQKLNEYKEKGYEALIPGYLGNQNRRRVNDTIEQLIVSIYCMENAPFGEWVTDYYNAFIGGKMTIPDAEKTGEILNPANFVDKNGKKILLAPSTIRFYLKKNEVLIDSIRNNRIDHITGKSPYNNRKLPDYSCSKVSMDDRTLPRRTLDGQKVNCYFAVDVKSSAWIGYTHVVRPLTVEDVYDTFRNMYNNLLLNGLMWPGEIEVEHFLMESIEDDLNRMFAEVTFCPSGLSRSKRAEHAVRSKKYSDEKRYQTGVGRWYLTPAYKTKSENKDEDYKEERLPAEAIIADDIESINRHNNTLHPDQKKYPGKTRWQVLVENQNPNLAPPQAHLLLRYLGKEAKTSITNSTFVRVLYNKYSIESYDLLKRLKPGNYEVRARYVACEDNEIDEVHLYQDDKYIGKAIKVERYQEAKVERTEKDEQIRLEQDKLQKKFHKMVKDEKASKYKKVAVIEPADTNYHEDEEPEVLDVKPDQETDNDTDDLDYGHSIEFYENKAVDDF